MYTYVGCGWMYYSGAPRQDVPWEVYRDAAMFDEVFDKKGALLQSRNTPKIISPLNSLQYSRYPFMCVRIIIILPDYV